MADSPAPVADPVAGLVDIPLPPLVSLWPQTWTALITIVFIVVGFVVWLCWFIHRRRVSRYRRDAIAELERMTRTSVSPVQLSAALALLVRRTALAAFPREQVAALTGPAWLSFLDRSYGGTEFSDGPGRDLEASVYRQLSSGDDASSLVDLVHRWIKVHHA